MNPKAARFLVLLEKRKEYINEYRNELLKIIELQEKGIITKDRVIEALVKVNGNIVEEETYGGLVSLKIPMLLMKELKYTTSVLNMSAPALYIDSKKGDFKYLGIQIPESLQQKVISGLKNAGVFFGNMEINYHAGLIVNNGDVDIDKNHFIINNEEVDLSAFGMSRYNASAFNYDIKLQEFDIIDLKLIIDNYNNNLVNELSLYQSERHAKDLEFIKCLASDSCDCSSFG